MKLSQLPVGALVKDIKSVYLGSVPTFRVLEHGHTGDPAGSTTLDFRDIICLKAFDAKESSNTDTDRQQYGNNRYLYSNILQWLNSDASAGNWHSAQHSADAPPISSNVSVNPYDTEAGFLSFMSAQFRAALKTVSKTTVKPSVDGGGSEVVSSKIFLLSTTEVGLANESSIAEGSVYSYYSSGGNDGRKKNLMNDAAKGNYSYATSPWNWWLRTPRYSNSSRVRDVSTDGAIGYNYAYRGEFGVSPAFCVSSDLVVTDTTDTDGAYTIEWPVIFDRLYVGDENNKSRLYKPEIITMSDGAGDIRFGIDSNGKYGYIKDGADTVTPFKGEPTLQSKTVSPTTSSQTVRPDSNYDGLSSVTVNAVQTQTKTATLSGSQQSIVSDSGKYLTSVTVPGVTGTATTKDVMGTSLSYDQSTYRVDSYQTTFSSSNNPTAVRGAGPHRFGFSGDAVEFSSGLASITPESYEAPGFMKARLVCGYKVGYAIPFNERSIFIIAYSNKNGNILPQIDIVMGDYYRDSSGVSHPAVLVCWCAKTGTCGQYWFLIDTQSIVDDTSGISHTRADMWMTGLSVSKGVPTFSYNLNVYEGIVDKNYLRLIGSISGAYLIRSEF